jgi:lipopolysaccharide export system permease protein
MTASGPVRIHDLWWPRLFVLAGYLLPVILVGAMGFTCAHMVKHRELVGVLAGGMSLWRVARPMIVATLALVALQAANREFLLPRLAPLLTRDKKEAGSRSLGVARDFVTDAQGRLIYAQRIDLDTGAIDGLWAWERDEQGLMTRRIQADRAEWNGRAWTLTNGRAIGRSAEGSRSVGGEHVATLESDVDPTALRLRRFEGLAANLSTRQLTELIARSERLPETPMNRRRIESFERIRWGRVASMTTTALVFVTCLPFFLRKEPVSMVRQSLLAAPIALGGFAASVLAGSLAVPGLPAQVGVFVPAMLVLPLAIGAAGSVRS